MPITPDEDPFPQSYIVRFELEGELFSTEMIFSSITSEEHQNDAAQALVNLLSSSPGVSNIDGRKISAQAYTITEEV